MGERDNSDGKDLSIFLYGLDLIFISSPSLRYAPGGCFQATNASNRANHPEQAASQSVSQPASLSSLLHYRVAFLIRGLSFRELV